MSLNNVTAGSARVSRLRKKRRRISLSSSVRVICACLCWFPVAAESNEDLDVFTVDLSTPVEV